MGRKRQTVWFVYRKARINRGSMIMRAHQLCALAQQHLDEDYDFRLLRMPGQSTPGLQSLWARTRPRGGIYFMTKVCTRALTTENALRLQAKADGVIFDHVDSDLRDIRIPGADVHLCCSYDMLAALKARQIRESIPGKPMLLLHNADARLYDQSFPGTDHFSPVYCGTESLGHLPDPIRARMDILDGSGVASMEEAIRRLPNYNFHYCLRSDDNPDDELYKPFTKGFTAAVCRSNVMAHRETSDVVEFLGEDYPYLVSSLSDQEVLDTLDRASLGFGGADWQRGMEVMRSVEDRISPSAIAAQIKSILRELGV